MAMPVVLTDWEDENTATPGLHQDPTDPSVPPPMPSAKGADPTKMKLDTSSSDEDDGKGKMRLDSSSDGEGEECKEAPMIRDKFNYTKTGPEISTKDFVFLFANGEEGSLQDEITTNVMDRYLRYLVGGSLRVVAC